MKRKKIWTNMTQYKKNLKKIAETCHRAYIFAKKGPTKEGKDCNSSPDLEILPFWEEMCLVVCRRYVYQNSEWTLKIHNFNTFKISVHFFPSHTTTTIDQGTTVNRYCKSLTT